MKEKQTVVIAGISGRFPECDDIQTFKSKLFNAENLVTISNKKWPADKQYYYKNDVVKLPAATGLYIKELPFDSPVFKFNSVFAESTTVVNRKGLEPAFEAIIDAGVNPYSLDGRNIGVYATYGLSETETNIYYTASSVALLLLVGGAKTMQSNRISYVFNLTGPSMSFAGDSLGDIQALKVAYDSISNGIVEGAIVVTASHLFDPKVSLQYLGLNILSPDGSNKVFDNTGNGFTRSEGCVALFLQRSQEAKRIYGTITVCDTNYSGLYQSPLIGCNGENLKDFLRTVYKKEKLEDISFMELSANGVKMLEKSEIDAIAKIMQEKGKDHLYVGSVISNIGSTEVSAPYISLLKALLCLEEGAIAPNINYSEPRNEIEPLKRKLIQVVDHVTKLQGNRVALNVLGLSGSMGHVVIKENSKKAECCKEDNLPRLLLICGRSEENLDKILTQIESMPYNKEMIHLINDAFIPHMPFHIYRGYTIFPIQTVSSHVIEERKNSKRPIWFVFSGMGSQWNGMGKGLLDLPVFAETIKKCSDVLKPKGIDLYHLITCDEPEIFDNVTNSFCSIISIQIALVEVLKILNIHPDGMIGHSAGEMGCAYADGCLTLEQAVLAAYERGKASLKVNLIGGMMAAIGKGYSHMKEIIPPGIEIACHNSDTSCTISGPTDDVISFVNGLKDQGIFAKMVNVSNIAYHSKHIAPAGPFLLSGLKKIITSPIKRSAKWISTSVPESNWDTEAAQYCSAEYFTNNLLNYVLFEEGCKHIPTEATIIEIAPHGLLQAILKRAFPEDCTSHIPLTRKTDTKDNLNFFLSAIGRLYIAGYDPNVNAIYPEISYPVPKGTPSIAPFCTWREDRKDTEKIQLIRRSKDEPLSAIPIPLRVQNGSEFSYLENHKCAGEIVAPIALYLVLVWRFFSYLRKEEIGSSDICFQNIKVHKILKLRSDKLKLVSIMIQGSGSFELILQNKNKKKFFVLMTGIIESPFDESDIKVTTNELNDNKIILTQEKVYQEFNGAGYKLDDDFQLIRNGRFGQKESLGEIEWKGNWVTFIDNVLKFHSFIKIAQDSVCYFPSRIRFITINKKFLLYVKSNPLVACHNDLLLKEICCNGLLIRDVVYDVYSTTMKKNMYLEHPNFPLISNNKFRVQFKSELISVQYYRIHDKKLLSKNIQQTGIEYAGLDKKHSRVIGLALNTEHSLTIDPELMWNIPNKWDSKYSSALPLAFIQVCYMAQSMKFLSDSLSIFINMGSELHFAEACIFFFITRGFTVFVSVSSDSERLWIQKRFGDNKFLQVIDQENCKYELQILQATKARGVDLVVNCVPGVEHLTACINCSCSSFFELGTKNFTDRNSIGLSSFMKIQKLEFVPAAVSDFISLPKLKKQALKRQVEENFFNKYFTPSEEYELEETVKEYTDPLFEPEDETLDSLINENQSYIIIGESKNHVMIEIIEWLVKEGATNCFVSVTDSPIKSSFTRHVNRLNSKLTKFLLLTPKNKFDTDNAMRLVTEAENTAPIAVAFVVSVNSQVVNIMNITLKKQKSDACLISFFSSGLEYCEKRRYSGYPAFVVEGNDDKMDVFSILDELKTHISDDKNNNSPTVLKIKKVHREFNKDTKSLSDYLPKDIDMLKRLSLDGEEIIEFKEMTSLSPRLKYTKDVNPIFFIPSVHEKGLEKILKRITQPVFCARIFNCKSSIKETVAQLYKSVLIIQPSGPVSLVAETWNCVLGIELSLLLRTNNRSCKLFLLEGVPKSWINFVKNVIPKTSSIDAYLMNELCASFKIRTTNLANKNQVEGDMISNVPHFDIIEENKIYLTDVVTSIRRQFKNLLEYEENDISLHDTTILTMNLSQKWNVKLSVTSEIEQIKANKYEDFISDPALAKFINCNTAFSWWYS